MIIATAMPRLELLVLLTLRKVNDVEKSAAFD
jgi:hypothetical protein